MTGTVSRKRHVFILGAPGSGTTLLKCVLVAHPRIGGTDYESTGIFSFRDIFDYAMGEFPPEVVRGLLARSGGIVDLYERLAARLLARSGKDVFVDKLWPKSYRLRIVRRHFPDSIFINIVRDGRDCFCSAVHHPNVPQSDSLERFARYWAGVVALPPKPIPPSHLRTIRYEDLTSTSEVTLGALMQFIGLEFSADQISVDRYASTTSIKKREVHQNLARPMSTQSHGRWRSELTPEQNARFCRIAGPALARHGYSLA